MKNCGMRYEGTRIRADWNNTGICDCALYGMVTYVGDGNAVQLTVDAQTEGAAQKAGDSAQTEENSRRTDRTHTEERDFR